MAIGTDPRTYALPSGGTHGTLAANVTASILISGNPTTIEVFNRSGSAEIYFTVNGVNPAVGASGTFVLPATICTYKLDLPDIDTDVRVLLISNGTPTYSVIGLYR